jgi:cytochrome c
MISVGGLLLFRGFPMTISRALLGLIFAVVPSAAHAGGDPMAGSRLFLQCRACHTVGPADRNGIGPNLNGVAGAKIASRAGYAYSPAMKAKGGAWTVSTFDAFLTRPMAAIPGTKMAFGGVANPKARADLISYLVTLKGAKR